MSYIYKDTSLDFIYAKSDYITGTNSESVDWNYNVNGIPLVYCKPNGSFSQQNPIPFKLPTEINFSAYFFEMTSSNFDVEIEYNLSTFRPYFNCTALKFILIGAGGSGGAGGADPITSFNTATSVVTLNSGINGTGGGGGGIVTFTVLNPSNKTFLLKIGKGGDSVSQYQDFFYNGENGNNGTETSVMVTQGIISKKYTQMGVDLVLAVIKMLAQLQVMVDEWVLSILLI